MPSERFAFGDFTLDASERRLTKGGETIALPPKAFDLLVALVRDAGHLLSKNELLTQVWPDTSVEEGVLTVYVSALRKALGESTGRPTFIQTVRGFGYRFLGSVSRDGDRLSLRSMAPEPSIAVLPFLDLADGSEHLYFSDGLTEDIINLLARIPGLRVTARTSAFAFRGKGQDIRRIAEALTVATVLEGSVRIVGHRIRVTAQLVNAENGCHLWSERYDRELTDIFAVQEEIAVALTSALEVALSGPLPDFRSSTSNLAAYEAYLKGLHYRREHTAQSMKQSLEWFERAIALDPAYSVAHVGLAACYVSMATEGVCMARDVMPAARSAAARALSLNPFDRDAQAILGTVALGFDYQADEVERIWKAVGPRADSYGAVWFGIQYLFSRQGAAAPIELLERALQLDPLNGLFRSILAFTLNWAGQSDRALEVGRRCVELDEGRGGGYFVMAMVHATKGQLADALDAAEKAYDAMPWHPRFAGLLAGVLVRNGDRARASSLLRQLTADPTMPGVAMGMIQYHLTSGEIDGALDWFERAASERDLLVVVYVRSPQMAPLWSTGRWAALLKMMNFPTAVADPNLEDAGPGSSPA